MPSCFLRATAASGFSESSYLPQVVRLAERHFLVAKSTDGVETRSRIGVLDDAQRVQELARMLGGGAAALKHAEALLNECGTLKK